MTQQEIKSFQNFILRWHTRHGRHELPWRQTRDPYSILVSELMLQQTQVERVIPKYAAFLQQFPTVSQLAHASLTDVLKLWQGLGYNRRARYLLLTAQHLMQESNGMFPQEEEHLRQLPGIGPYTASAIAAFAYNQPTILIETNVRAVFLYNFFSEQSNVSDNKLLKLIAKTQENQTPRTWYAALMDYGAVLKKLVKNPTTKSKHYTKQSKFAGSVRQVRGEIIRILTKHDSMDEQQLRATLKSNKRHFATAIQQLTQEKLINHDGKKISLPV